MLEEEILEAADSQVVVQAQVALAVQVVAVSRAEDSSTNKI